MVFPSWCWLPAPRKLHRTPTIVTPGLVGPTHPICLGCLPPSQLQRSSHQSRHSCGRRATAAASAVSSPNSQPASASPGGLGKASLIHSRVGGHSNSTQVWPHSTADTVFSPEAQVAEPESMEGWTLTEGERQREEPAETGQGLPPRNLTATCASLRNSAPLSNVSPPICFSSFPASLSVLPPSSDLGLHITVPSP